MNFKSGYITILGAPNVGKSTLLNAILQEKLSIVSEKPQTTRDRILGIYNLPQGQLLFLDTPGLHEPHKKLNECMVEAARSTLADADLIYYVVGPSPHIQETDITFIHEIEKTKKPWVMVINKIDQIHKLSLLPVLEAWRQRCEPKDFFLVSALKHDGIDELIQKSLAWLPEGPAYYPEDQMTDRNTRYLVSEIIREKIFELTYQELPYSTAVVIDEFIEHPDRSFDEISATIYVEKTSQKPIVIGKQGLMLKEIGTLARKEIENLTQRKTFLKLFVKVVDDWTKKDFVLRELGYKK